MLSKPAPHQSLEFQQDHVSIRVEPLQWHYLPVGRNQFLFRAQQTQMQFDDGKISWSGHDQILSISQITSLTFERFTNTVRSLTFLLLFLSDTFLTCLMDAASNSQQGEKNTSPPNTLTFCRSICPLKTCIQKFHVWKHLQRRSLRMHKLTIWKKDKLKASGSHICRKWGWIVV